jgi:hypothetical protein
VLSFGSRSKYVSTTSSSVSEAPSNDSSVTYPMNPVMEEKYHKFNSVEPLADHEREQFIANSDEGGLDLPGSLNSLSQSNWQKHFVDFSIGISNENRWNIFA